MDEDEQLLPGFKVVKKERIVKTFLIHLYFCNMGLGRKCKPDGAKLLQKFYKWLEEDEVHKSMSVFTFHCF